MAPRRQLGQQQQQQQQGQGNGGSAFSLSHPSTLIEAILDDLTPPGKTRCCVPTGECFRLQQNPFPGALDEDPMLISLDDLRDTVRVICNNEQCSVGQYMHRECFEQWEQMLLTYLKTCGRARSWSERQRHQNLWTKKGYDLAYKACGCRCRRGHLKKDLDWMPPPPTSNILGRIEDLNGLAVVGGGGCQMNNNTVLMDAAAAGGKKNRRRRNNNGNNSNRQNALKPAVMSGNGMTLQHSLHQQHPFQTMAVQPLPPPPPPAPQMALDPRGRTNSLSSSTGSSSPPTSMTSSGFSDQSSSPINNGYNRRIFRKHFAERAGGGANGIFSRRENFHSFNILPKIKCNSYQVKVEDEGTHGNDDTRCFILSTLASQGRSKVQCVLCEEMLPVFDRYPLVDGTFFLSPRQHAQSCIEVKVEGRIQYLSMVCMECAEGANGRAVSCIYCKQKWDGSSLLLGTMYSYDVFAAMPCCTERIKCNRCFKPVLNPSQRLNFFSDYSHMFPCQYCSAMDTHFVKPLRYCFTRQLVRPLTLWP